MAPPPPEACIARWPGATRPQPASPRDEERTPLTLSPQTPAELGVWATGRVRSISIFGPLGDFQVRHHPRVLVLELVAVHEVEAAIGIEADQHLDGLAVLEEDGVLQSEVTPVTVPAIRREARLVRLPQ
jgi:hypothetical protein